jgi:hypothetical protein
MKKKIEVVIDGKDNTGKTFSSVEKQLGRLDSVAKKAGSSIAAALSIGAFAAWIDSSNDAADAAGKSAAAVGMAVDEYTGLAYAAKLSDVAVSELDAAMSKFNKTADAAAQGATGPSEAFKRLGISITDADGRLKSNQQLLAEVADKFQAMPNGIEKSALAMQLFGRAGTKMIPLLNAGAKGLADMRAEAEALGLEIGADQAANAEVFNDNLTRLGTVSEGAANQVAEQMLPTLVDLSELMVDVTRNTEATSVAASALGSVFKVLATAVIIAGDAFGAIGRFIGGAAAAANAAIHGDFSQAADIMRSIGEDNARETALATARIEKLWNGTGEATAKAAVEQKVIMKSLTFGLKEEQDQQVKNAKAALAERVKAERAAASQLDKAKQAQLDTEKRYKEALAQLNAGAGGKADFGAAMDLKVGARKALAGGDVEQAKAQAQASLKIIQDLAASGSNTYGFAGFIKELRAIEQGADKINVDRAEESLAAAKQSAADLKTQLDEVAAVKITPTMDEAAAQAARDQVAALAKELNQTLVIAPTLDYSKPYTLKDPVKPAGYAGGGQVRGPGSGTSDSILARLSAGEYVVRAAAVRQYGTNLLDRLNGLHLPRFADGGLVSGIEPAGGARSLGTVNLTLPGGERYSLLADQQSFAELTKRQKWKRGSTRA